MRKDEIDKRIEHVVQEGLDGITPLDYRPNKAMGLEEEDQAVYYAKIRKDLDRYSSHRVMDVGVDHAAQVLFGEVWS